MVVMKELNKMTDGWPSAGAIQPSTNPDGS
jgi:hypothetical protein